MNIKTLEYVLPKTIFIVLYTYIEHIIHRVDKIDEFQSEDFLSDYCQKK